MKCNQQTQRVETGGRVATTIKEQSVHALEIVNVQSIKPPTLLEIYGPLFMSYPAASTVQYRLSEENGITRLKFMHRAMGQVSHDVQIERGWASIEPSWGNMIARIRSAAQKAADAVR
jgi:hypothetical protein